MPDPCFNKNTKTKPDKRKEFSVLPGQFGELGGDCNPISVLTSVDSADSNDPVEKRGSGREEKESKALSLAESAETAEKESHVCEQYQETA